MPMSDESILQAFEFTADQVDCLAEIIDEFLTMADAGVQMSATTRQKYAAEIGPNYADSGRSCGRQSRTSGC